MRAPGRDQGRAGGEGDDEGGAQVRLDHDQERGRADDEQERHQALDAARPLRFAGEQVGGVEDERDLGQLRGLDLQEAGADPTARAVDRGARPEHRDEEDEGDGEEDRRQAPDRLQPVAGDEMHEQEADGADHQRPLQVEGEFGEAAVAQHLGGRAGREDHHRAEGQQT